MLRNRTLLAVSCAVGAAYVGIGMVVPVRVLYAQSRGASLAIIGAMASAFLLSNFVFQYPTGWIADLWGRKRTMAVSLALQALLSLVYLAVTDPILFVALRFLEGIVSAGVLPSARAIVADAVPEERRGEAYGIFSSFFNAGFLIGPALGGFFAALGYTTAFVGSCAFRLVALVIVLLAVNVHGRSTHEQRLRAKAVPRRALFTLPLLAAYVLVVGDYLYLGFDLTLMPIWMRHNLGASVMLIGLVYALWALPNIIGAPFGGRIADRVRRSGLIVIFGLAQVPMYVAYGLVSSAIAVAALFAIHGAIFSLMQPAVDAHLAASSPPDARARAQGIYSALGLASAFVAANALPILYGHNFRLPLFVMGAGFGVSVLIGGTLVRISERQGLVPAFQASPRPAES